MKQQHWSFGLMGKGFFAFAALMLMLGGEQDARAKQAEDIAGPMQQRLLDVRPAPLPTVRANAEARTGEAAQSWVF